MAGQSAEEVRKAARPASARRPVRVAGQTARARPAVGLADRRSQIAVARNAREPRPGQAAAGAGPAGLAVVDRELQAWRARMTAGASPVAFSLAYLDWLAHLAGLPGRQAGLAIRAW